MDSLTIARLAEEFNVCSKTVRRAASRLGVKGELLRRGTWSARVFGPPEAERLRAYFREHAPEPEPVEEPVVGGGEEPVVERQEGTLALPPAGQVGEFLDLLADLRDQLARAGAREEETVEVLRQLAAPAPTAAPRVRWRTVVEVSLLAVVAVLACAMCAAVARVLQVNGAIALPW